MTVYALKSKAMSWGRVVRGPQMVAEPRHAGDLAATVAASPNAQCLGVGLRRSYGDSVFCTRGGVIEMTGLDRLLGIDAAAGTLRAEAGVSLGEIMRRVVPLGYFVPVSPGTRFVTLGGAIANDVHGKNHHRVGTFGRHVLALGLLRSDGTRLTIGPDAHPELFAATIGGLGLTGLIEWAQIALAPIASSYIDAETVPFGTLAEFWDLAATSAQSHEHTVAWIDCTARGKRAGRGIFSRGNWSAEGGLEPHAPGQRRRMPLEAPNGALNSLTVGAFNRLYYASGQRKAGKSRVHYAPFFHPLDAIADWNRLYGRQGFWQYQGVVPTSTMKEAIPALLGAIAQSRQGSFLAVLKTCGGLPSPGLLSFPMAGATLALDFPNRGAATLELFTRLDAIVRTAGGRLYAAKDGRIPKDMWAAGYPATVRFIPHIDPAFSSDFWKRVAP